MSRTLLLTRALEQAKEFAERVEQETDFKCHIAPMQEMRDLPADIDFEGVDALVFTSRNGVASFARRWEMRGIPAYCVGHATAKSAISAGMIAHVANGNSESLIDLVNQAGVENPLHIHGKHKASDLAINGNGIVIYDQVALPLDVEATRLLAAGEIGAVALFSPRSAQLFADIWQDDWPNVEFFCISEATAALVTNIGNVRICQQPNAESMLALIQQ